MKNIQLTNGKYAIVDNEDFEHLNEWRWEMNRQGYALRRVRHGVGKREIIWMHRLINNTPCGFDTDHINRNKLDNTRKNLRTTTRSQNKLNVGLRSDNSSGYRGISFHIRDKLWQASITIMGKNIHLGAFKNIKDAISARKEADLKYCL